MRVLMLFLVGLFFTSCKEHTELSHVKEIEDILTDGEWRLISTEEKFTRFQNGLKFSKDRQVFNIDSQGQIVAPTHERLFTVSGDTLTMVDYKFEERFMFSKGTDILVIKDLSKDKMILEALHPEKFSKLTFENMH